MAVLEKKESICYSNKSHFFDDIFPGGDRMKKLILAEKPSVAKNIADATNAVRKNGYFEGNE